MNKKNRIIGALALIIAAMAVMLTACSGEPMAMYGRARIVLAEPATRSITPDIPAKADHYTITWTAKDEITPVPPVKEDVSLDETGAVTYDRVHIGTYSVTVEGFDASGVKILDGKSTDFTVLANKDTNADVHLDTVVTEGVPGKLSVTYDWTQVKDQEGPLQEAIASGTLKLEVVNNDGAVIENWPQIQTAAVEPDAAGVAFSFDMPARKAAWDITLELCNADGWCLYSVPAQATIRSGLTSTPKLGTSESLTITLNPEGGKGVRILDTALNKTHPETTVDLTIATYPGAKNLIFKVFDITSGSDQASFTTAPYSVTSHVGVYAVSGLEIGKTYRIEVNVQYQKGPDSKFRPYEQLSSITTKKPVESVSFVAPSSYSVPTDGGAFHLEAKLNPADATETGATVSFSDPSVFSIPEAKIDAVGGTFDLVLTPLKPGKTTVTIESDESFEKAPFSATTETFTVKLASPKEVTAAKEPEGLGIVLTWKAGDTFSNTYSIERKIGEGSFEALADYSLPAGPDGTFTYLDKELTGGKSYSYRITAKSTDETLKAAEFNSDHSAETASVTAESIAAPTIESAALTEGSVGIKIDWTASTYADKYTVSRWDSKTSAWTDAYAELGNVLTYTDTVIEGGVKYKYRVMAKSSVYTSAGLNSAWSAEKEIEAKLAAPTAPKAVNSEDGTGVDVSWTAGDALADSYTIDRFDGASWTNGWKTVSETSLKDTDIVTNTAYHYRVTATSTLYGAAFNSASAEVTLAPATANVTITVHMPKEGTLKAITSEVKTVTETQDLDLTIQDGIEGATTYRWTLDGMALDAFDDKTTVKVTLDDCRKASSRSNHILAVMTDNGVSATYAFNTEYFVLNTTAPEFRLPYDYAATYYIWGESDNETDYTLSVKSATLDGNAVDHNTFCSLDPNGILTVKAPGTVTIEAAGKDGRKAEMTFCFYAPVFVPKTFIADFSRNLSTQLKQIDKGNWDWWYAFGDDKSNDAKTITAHSSTSGSTDATVARGTIDFNKYVYTTSDMITCTVAPVKTETIDFVPYNNSSSGGNLGDDDLALIGKDKHGPLTVKLDGNRGIVKITINDVNVKNAGPVGSYSITFTEPLGAYDGNTWTYMPSETPTSVNNSDLAAEDRIKVY